MEAPLWEAFLKAYVLLVCCRIHVNRSRQQKFEMAREARNNEFALKFQESLNSGEGGAFTRVTRRMLALIGMGTLSFITCATCLYPSVPLTTFSNITGEGRNEFLFGLISYHGTSPYGRYNRTYRALCDSCLHNDRGLLLHTWRTPLTITLIEANDSPVRGTMTDKRRLIITNINNNPLK